MFARIELHKKVMNYDFDHDVTVWETLQLSLRTAHKNLPEHSKTLSRKEFQVLLTWIPACENLFDAILNCHGPTLKWNESVLLRRIGFNYFLVPVYYGKDRLRRKEKCSKLVSRDGTINENTGKTNSIGIWDFLKMKQKML